MYLTYYIFMFQPNVEMSHSACDEGQWSQTHKHTHTHKYTCWRNWHPALRMGVALWGRQFGWWPCLSLLLPLCPSGGPCWDLGLEQRTDCNFNLFSCGTETWGPGAAVKNNLGQGKDSNSRVWYSIKIHRETCFKIDWGHFATNRERKIY